MNFFLLPFPEEMGSFKEERLQYFGENIIQNYDILCFQEVFRTLSKRKDKFINYAREAGMDYSATPDIPPSLSWFWTDGGSVTTSRYQILERDFMPFKQAFALDAMGYNGNLYTKIVIQDHTLHLFNVHHQASYFSGSANDILGNFFTRFSQFEQSIAFMYEKTKNVPSDDLILYVGDMNTRGYYGKDDNDWITGFKERIRSNTGLEGYHDLILGEYEKVLEILSYEGAFEVTDHLLEANSGVHVATIGVSTTLDYVFQLKKTDTSIVSGKSTKLVVDQGQMSVNRFDITGEVFDKLSDHHGIEAVLKIE